MTQDQVRYLVFDIESVADGSLIRKLKYPGESMSPEEAVDRFRAELMEKYNNDFIPYTFQVPISVVVATVNKEFRLMELVALDEPQSRPHVLTDHFWRGWSKHDRPTLVSFNGRSFDIPLMELAAFRYGVQLPHWFEETARSFEQPRHRYNNAYHLDIHEILTNYGATRFTGGLNLAANLLGKPGKMDVQGDMVQDLYTAGRISEINDYCRCDVLDTYFVFLRAALILGWLELDREQEILEDTKAWMTELAATNSIFQQYLDHWGDWDNPWKE